MFTMGTYQCPYHLILLWIELAFQVPTVKVIYYKCMHSRYYRCLYNLTSSVGVLEDIVIRLGRSLVATKAHDVPDPCAYD